MAPLPGVPGDAPPHLSPVFETLRSEAPHRHPHVEARLTSYNRKHRLRDVVQLGQTLRESRGAPREPRPSSSKACAPPSETALWGIDGLSQSVSGTSEGRPRDLAPGTDPGWGVASEMRNRSRAQTKGHSPSTDAQVTVQRRK